MPSTSGKIRKKPTSATRAISTVKKTAPAKKTTTTKKAATVKKTTTSTKQSTTTERIGTLEEKVDKLLTILDAEFRSELRQGPKSLSNKLRSAGLVVKN